GSPANAYLGPTDDGVVRLEHPTGSFDAVVEVTARPDGTVEVGRAGIIRTARKLMDGVAFPRAAAR
ncbi:MAG: 4-oxalomesaconate tautomerase, partial [Ilumatobacter sp.]